MILYRSGLNMRVEPVIRLLHRIIDVTNKITFTLLAGVSVHDLVLCITTVNFAIDKEQNKP